MNEDRAPVRNTVNQTQPFHNGSASRCFPQVACTCLIHILPLNPPVKPLDFVWNGLGANVDIKIYCNEIRSGKPKLINFSVYK